MSVSLAWPDPSRSRPLVSCARRVWPRETSLAAQTLARETNARLGECMVSVCIDSRAPMQDKLVYERAVVYDQDLA